MGVKSLIELLGSESDSVEEIPYGIKENVYIKIKNSENTSKRKEGVRSSFWDDCGSWEKGITNKSIYVKDGSNYTKVVFRDSCYNLERTKDKKKVY